MNSFHQSVEGWHDTFTLLGTAAVTLLGLLFIAVSLREDIRNQQADRYVQMMVGQNLLSFLTAFLISVYLLIPGISARTIAISISATVMFPLISTLKTVPEYARRMRENRGLFFWYGVVQPVCYAAALLSAVVVGRYEESAISAIMTVTIFLIVIPTMNAWQLTSSTGKID